MSVIHIGWKAAGEKRSQPFTMLLLDCLVLAACLDLVLLSVVLFLA